MNPSCLSTPPEANSQTLFFSGNGDMTHSPLSLLRLYEEWGVDTAIGDSATDQRESTFTPVPVTLRHTDTATAAPQTRQQAAATPPAAQRARNPVAQHASMPGESVEAARKVARQATSVAELKTVMEQFHGFSLYKTAIHTLFAHGPRHAPLMIIGDAPDADEDRSGNVFSGLCGSLLDQMLNAAGIDKKTLLLATALPWRPPGGRPPSEIEIQTCRPFLEQTIRLFAPQRLLLCGSMPSRVLTGSAKLPAAHTWHDLTLEEYPEPLPMMSIRHPLQLRASAAARKDIWATLLLVAQTLQQKN
ncbi:uracil-DNA glycosylase [Acetobacter thailandicus]|uniref:uracil-DNA glycosylase n=1 Tax=Acetobacter thailandicus TaxID=1502842 RepID=UPI001FD55FCC|nr:uracil-DNA glycosylase [Acetobacter thailandicus]